MPTKIAIGSIIHESNTFSTVPTTLDDFKRKQYLVKNEIISSHRETGSEIDGFLHEISGRATIVPTLSAIAMPSGTIIAQAYNHLKVHLFDLLAEEKIDAIFLALHGSMCVEGLEDPEGDLLAHLRAGYPHIIIGCTLDHHANVTKEMVMNTDFIVGYRTHPHVDQFEVGCEAARLMMLPGLKELDKAFIRIPMVTRAENRGEPIAKLREHAHKLMGIEGIHSASFFVGYPWADVSIMGCSVYVLQEPRIPSSHIEEFASLFWSLRDDFHFKIESLDSIPILLQEKTDGPLILNELSDCTFGGSSGDVVSTAAYLANNNVKDSIVVGIVDSQCIEEAFKLGVHAIAPMSVGGKICRKDNPPLVGEMEIVSLQEQVRPISPMMMESGMLFKQVAILRFKTILLAVIPYPGQIGGPAFLEAIGYDPSSFTCIVVKEGMNPFVTYADIASRIIMIDSPGFNPQKLASGMYSNITERIYPIFPVEADAFVPRRCL